MTQTKTLATFKIDPVVWESFKIWATTQNSNAAEILRHLIGECIDGKISAPSKNNEAQQQAIAGIDERIDARLDERIAAMEFRLDERTSERLEEVWAELGELKGQIEQLQKTPLSESPTTNERESADTIPPAREQICLPIDGLPEVEPIAAAAVEGSASRRKTDRPGEIVSNSSMISEAKRLGWMRGRGQSAGDFMEERGWGYVEGVSQYTKWRVGIKSEA
jgi:hypothetical protein